VNASQLFDPMALAEFGDAGGRRVAGPPLPRKVAELAAYLDGARSRGGEGVLATPAKVKAWIELLTGDRAGREVTIFERGVIALRIDPTSWPVVLFRPSGWETRICRLCGCTPDLVCVGGCMSVGASLCSRCVAVKTIARIHADNSRRGPGRGGRWCP
jgi:hypothetical protein